MTRKPKRHAVLIGLRASGKTTIGRLAAERLGLGFADLDDLTPRKLGASTAAEALQSAGENAFRDAEAEALREVLAAKPMLIALGGGTPTAPGAADTLRDAGTMIVYLRAQPETLGVRLAQTDLTSRPSITGRGVIEEVAELFDRRDPVYRRLAHVVIDTDPMDAAAMVDAVIRALEQDVPTREA